MTPCSFYRSFLEKNTELLQSTRCFRSLERSCCRFSFSASFPWLMLALLFTSHRNGGWVAGGERFFSSLIKTTTFLQKTATYNKYLFTSSALHYTCIHPRLRKKTHLPPLQHPSYCWAFQECPGLDAAYCRAKYRLSLQNGFSMFCPVRVSRGTCTRSLNGETSAHLLWCTM